MRRNVLAFAGRWETVLAIGTIVVLLVASATTPGFLDGFNLASATSIMSEKALMVLPLALLIVAREIDISIASIAGLCAVSAGIMLRDGHPVPVAVAVALLVGILCGAFNGFCVAILGMPSLVVTLGTLALFRGLCFVLLGGEPVTTVPESLISFSNDNVPGTYIPLDILPFLVLAPVFGLVLHRLPTGRRIFAIGGNPATARYAAVGVTRIRFGLFVVSGAVCAVAGVINIGRTSQASPDALTGYELDAITVVFLGGVSFLGGKGRISGVVWALVLLTGLRSALQLNNVSAYAQGTAVGVLLVSSLLVANLAGRFAHRSRRSGTTAAPPVLGDTPLAEARSD